MEETIAFNTFQQPVLIIDNDLDDTILYPEKLKEARETLSKHPIPAEIYLLRFSKEEQEQGFWINGVVRKADADNNTFTVISTAQFTQTQYIIHTQLKILNSIVKNYWGKPLKAHILPKINKDEKFEYELLSTI